MVGMVRACLRSRASDGVETEAEVAGFMMALGDLPAFALNEAARRVICGDAGGLSRTFVPTPAEMRALAVEIRGPAKWHAMQLEKLLIASPVSTENKPSPERAREILAQIMVALPEAKTRGLRNPSGVDHSNKAGW